ncbi:hypothetical protein FNV43_RR16436 [Rhamnella rubrinervis]|uniref:Response regulatory domain-containing protein n=1 Tax=Rhamnella rubrinervis TaxID=2594499 RepID=A0A8K0MCX2_9ROSA|nr:hypothetical protein FNV43_RR16436 [Rhamnella rubrinervis]
MGEHAWGMRDEAKAWHGMGSKSQKGIKRNWPLVATSPPPAQDMIWDDIWSDLALWDVDFGGSYYFNTKLLLLSSPPPLASTDPTQPSKENINCLKLIPSPCSAIWLLLLDLHFAGAMGMAATESQFHVLAVDDSLIDRKLIERLLKTSSYQVTTVDSGSKALEFLGLREDDEHHHINPDTPCVSPNNHQEVEVNLIITDYCMPGMTGYDLLKKIKESSSLKNIPVVIMSSENVPSRISRCLEEGAEEFFLKPVRLADVNKLKPHMMKTKSRDEKLEKQENQINPEDKLDNQDSRSELHKQQHQDHQQQQQQQHQANSNKRKTMEENLNSPDRTRPRYSGLTTVV